MDIRISGVNTGIIHGIIQSTLVATTSASLNRAMFPNCRNFHTLIHLLDMISGKLDALENNEYDRVIQMGQETLDIARSKSFDRSLIAYAGGCFRGLAAIDMERTKQYGRPLRSDNATERMVRLHRHGGILIGEYLESRLAMIHPAIPDGKASAFLLRTEQMAKELIGFGFTGHEISVAVCALSHAAEAGRFDEPFMGKVISDVRKAICLHNEVGGNSLVTMMNEILSDEFGSIVVKRQLKNDLFIVNLTRALYSRTTRLSPNDSAGIALLKTHLELKKTSINHFYSSIPKTDLIHDACVKALSTLAECNFSTIQEGLNRFVSAFDRQLASITGDEDIANKLNTIMERDIGGIISSQKLASKSLNS